MAVDRAKFDFARVGKGDLTRCARLDLPASGKLESSQIGCDVTAWRTKDSETIDTQLGAYYQK